MSHLDAGRLEGHRELRLAHLQLCILAAGYVWQEGEAGAAKVPGIDVFICLAKGQSLTIYLFFIKGETFGIVVCFE